MAFNFPFFGMNRRYVHPEAEPRFPDMLGHNNGVVTFSCWRPGIDELRQIVETGEIWLGVMNGSAPMAQTFVGSLSSIKKDCADLGKIFPAKPKEIVDESTDEK